MTEGKEHFEVQHYTLVDGWVNCWTTYDENDGEYPTTYGTYEEAVLDLDDMFFEQDYEVTLGLLEPEHRHSDDQYRIVHFVENDVPRIYPYQWVFKKAEDQ